MLYQLAGRKNYSQYPIILYPLLQNSFICDILNFRAEYVGDYLPYKPVFSDGWSPGMLPKFGH